MQQERKHLRQTLVVVVLVVRTGCMTNVFIDKRQRMQLIGVAEHTGVIRRTQAALENNVHLSTLNT